MNLLSRLRQEWAKNDGKPREEWAPGRDLKETVLVVALAATVVAQIALLGSTWIG